LVAFETGSNQVFVIWVVITGYERAVGGNAPRSMKAISVLDVHAGALVKVETDLDVTMLESQEAGASGPPGERDYYCHGTVSTGYSTAVRFNIRDNALAPDIEAVRSGFSFAIHTRPFCWPGSRRTQIGAVGYETAFASQTVEGVLDIGGRQVELCGFGWPPSPWNAPWPTPARDLALSTGAARFSDGALVTWVSVAERSAGGWRLRSTDFLGLTPEGSITAWPGETERPRAIAHEFDLIGSNRSGAHPVLATPFGNYRMAPDDRFGEAPDFGKARDPWRGVVALTAECGAGQGRGYCTPLYAPP
jgi:hypothetical protein